MKRPNSKFASFITVLCAAAVLAAAPLSTAHAAKKKEFNIAWTIYVGWMPWQYAADQGIVKKWADKYGITINVKQINDYVEFDQSIHRRQVRRRHRHQHGYADHSLGRRRRFIGHHHGRLFQRQ